MSYEFLCSKLALTLLPSPLSLLPLPSPLPPSPPSPPSHINRGRLEQLVAEHLDHIHYISDVFSLDIQPLNDILSDHFLNRLLIPLYVNSLVDDSMADQEMQDDEVVYPSVSNNILKLKECCLFRHHNNHNFGRYACMYVCMYTCNSVYIEFV